MTSPDRSPSLTLVNHSLALLLEIGLIIAFVRAGLLFGQGIWSWIFAAIMGGLVILAWWRFAAPKSPTRLQMPAILVFKICIFSVGAALFAATVPIWLAAVFAVLAVVHLGLATYLNLV